ncbi:sulfatase [bacterium]|nr:sulfatase [bacterium]
MKLREIIKKTSRLTLFGILACYAYTAFYFTSHLVFGDSNIVWGLLGDGPHHAILFIVGVLFLFPIIGAPASFITGLVSTLVTDRIKGLNEARREHIGLIAVALVTTGVLGLPPILGQLFGHLRTLLGLLVALCIGAVLVFGAIKLPRIELWARRIAGGLLGLATLLFTFFYLFALGNFAYTEQSENLPGPNVLIILSDAHRADIASTFGGDVPTPNLDRLAARGVRFNRCYSTSNWTVPAVASLFTGTSHAVHGVDGFRPLSDTLPTLQGLLGREGYRCWGLFCNTAINPRTNLFADFSTYANYSIFRTPALGVMSNKTGPLYARYSFLLTRLFLRADVQHIKTITPELAVELSAQLRPAGGTFAYIHLYDPHLPYAPPDRFVPEGAYDGPMGRRLGNDFAGVIKRRGPDAIHGEDRRMIIELYRGEVRYEDEIIGRILDTLEETGAIENTAVFFVADHGEELWDHGDWGHGQTMYDEVVRVPLIASWPGVLPEGKVRDDRVSIGDIFPTVLDTLGIVYDSGPLAARSLLLPPDPERVIFSEHNDPDLVRIDRPIHQITVHAPEGSLILDRDTGDVSYFLPEDVTQRREVGDEYPERRDYLLGLIEEYDAEQTALCEVYNPRTGGLSAEATAAQLENLRAIGYLQ